MNKVLDKFLNDDSSTKVEGYHYIFIYITFIFGFCFSIYPGTFGANKTILYSITQVNLPYVISIWGALAMLVGVTTVMNQYFRNAVIGPWSAFLGAAVWSYASYIYIFDHFWVGLLAISIPNLAFWSLLYIRLKRYYRTHTAG